MMMKQLRTFSRLNEPASVASVSALIVLAMIAAAVTVIGCAWSGTYHSVRFNDFQSEREMGRLPPLPTMPKGMNQKRIVWQMETGEDFEATEKQTHHIDDLWARGEAAEQAGNLRLDRDLLNAFLKETAEPRAISDKRNSAFDRLDALATLDHGSKESAVKAYLDARRLHDAAKPDTEQVTGALDAIPHDSNLADNVAYLRAAELYRQEQYAEAAEAFTALNRQYPRSEKREAAFLMTALATMKTSATYIAASGNADWDDPKKLTITADQAWQDAFTTFQKLMTEYPRGKYFNEARGWLAYLYLRRRDRVNAMVEYYRLLADQQDESARVEGAFSLMLVRAPATDDEMNRVENALANEPQAALAYAYHNIYNYSIDPISDYPPNDDDNTYASLSYEEQERHQKEVEREWDKKRRDTGQQEQLRILEFSKRLMSKYPNLSIGGGFALRAAQASTEFGDNQSAVQFAQRALSAGLEKERRAQALWTLGIAEHRLHHFDKARQALSQLLHDYPQGPLTEETRRALAMVAEDAGDIDSALEQYVALKYNIDVGYLVDYLMTPEQLAAFIEKHPQSPRKNEFTYALGVRYLRLNQWEKARQTLGQVKTATVSDYNYYCAACGCTENSGVKCADPKADALEIEEDTFGKKDVPPSLVLRDIQTANDLETLERNANQAVGDNARAEALYQYASYQYQAPSLLFYNPLAVPGYYNLGMLAGNGRYRASNEAQILFNSQQEHERLARALKIYLQVAARFPRTKAARDALYTAAVCHERLSDYNPYWRGIYKNGLHAGDRMVTYADVKATYPNYQLPRGTYGWQPLTRTVSNGPGWEPPPPPPPKPRRFTRTERVKFYAGIVRDHSTRFWNENGKRWLIEIALGFGLIVMIRMARRNQRRLRARIARQRIQQAKQIVRYPWFDWFWIEPVIPSRREQIRKLLNDKRQEFIDLAGDRRSRPVLFRSIVSDVAVTGLAVTLIWTIWCG